MQITFPVEVEFHNNVNYILKSFCNMFPELDFVYEPLEEKEILERLLQKKEIFMSAYNSFLNPDNKLTDLDVTNIAFSLYDRKPKKSQTILELKNNSKWIKMSDPITIINIFLEQNSYVKSFKEMYQMCLDNDFYFLVKENLIYIGLAFSKSKEPLDIFIFNKDNMIPDISLKYHVDTLLLFLNINAENLKYKEDKINKVIHNFENDYYWSYISDINEITRLGKLQNNKLQNRDFALDYNNFREIYFLFNKEKQPLLMASFNRISDEPSSIISIEGENIDKIFEPYINFILKFKEQDNFTVKYNEDVKKLH